MSPSPVVAALGGNALLRRGEPADAATQRRNVAQLRARAFAGGSMGPKVEAAARFAEQTGHAAAMGALDEAALLLDGLHGTTVALSMRGAATDEIVSPDAQRSPATIGVARPSQ